MNILFCITKLYLINDFSLLILLQIIINMVYNISLYGHIFEEVLLYFFHMLKLTILDFSYFLILINIIHLMQILNFFLLLRILLHYFVIYIKPNELLEDLVLFLKLNSMYNLFIFYYLIFSNFL